MLWDGETEGSQEGKTIEVCFKRRRKSRHKLCQSTNGPSEERVNLIIISPSD